MSTGPCIIFDKSSLQILSKAEANWMEHLFRGVLTPTLLIEVIADLKKAGKAGRTPEAEVTNLAEKIGSLGTTPNVDFAELVIGDLELDERSSSRGQARRRSARQSQIVPATKGLTLGGNRG